MGCCGVSPRARDVTSGRCVRGELKARARRRFWRREDVGESEADRDEPEGGGGRRDWMGMGAAVDAWSVRG
ncbi:hypothetical protein GW17_00003365 [Ensete ventricosum]|nr:hypothetical protein GW17_00003365 [Ensete ventricosum]